jgi:hypothetical protein
VLRPRNRLVADLDRAVTAADIMSLEAADVPASCCSGTVLADE